MLPELEGVEETVVAEYEVYDGDGDIEDHEVAAYEIGGGDLEAVLVAGSHGEEIGSQYVAEELVEELSDEDLDGAVAVIPDANIFAQLYGERETSGRFKPDAPEEGDLNRVFDEARAALDGDCERDELHLTQQLAHDLLAYLDDAGDDACLIDMHTAAYPDRKMPQIRYKYGDGFEADTETMDELARSSGMEYMMAGEVTPEQSTMLAAAAPMIGMPAVTIEIGGAEKLYDEQDHFTPGDAALYRETVRNLLTHCGVLDGEPPETAVTELEQLSRTYTETAGDVEYHAELGEAVEEGEPVATIYQDGEEAVTYAARVDGVLEGRKDNADPASEYDAWVTQGMRLFNIAELAE